MKSLVIAASMMLLAGCATTTTARTDADKGTQANPQQERVQLPPLQIKPLGASAQA